MCLTFFKKMPEPRREKINLEDFLSGKLHRKDFLGIEVSTDHQFKEESLISAHIVREDLVLPPRS